MHVCALLLCRSSQGEWDKIKCVNFVNQAFFLLTSGNLLVHKTDLLALYLSGTYCHKTSTRSPSCYPPRQPAIDGWKGGWMDGNKENMVSWNAWRNSKTEYWIWDLNISSDVERWEVIFFETFHKKVRSVL